jgi:hypothetical protein
MSFTASADTLHPINAPSAKRHTGFHCTQSLLHDFVFMSHTQSPATGAESTSMAVKASADMFAFETAVLLAGMTTMQ